MSDQEQQEQKEEPRKQPVKEQVKLLKRALEFAEGAESYKAVMDISNRDTTIFANGGANAYKNTVLAEYILKAEREYVASMAGFILGLAKGKLESDIVEIREMLND